MIKYKSPHKTFTGTFELPEYDDFTGEMFNMYRDLLESKDNGKQSKYAHDLRRKAAFAGIHVIDKFGVWNIKGVSIADFREWETRPERENPRLVGWVGQSFAEYFQRAIDPNG